MAAAVASERIPTFCALCVSRCGAIATVEEGVFTALHADPAHPTGAALCIKGRVAPELVHHPGRILHPMERTQPKGAADPGWRRISWDEALTRAAERLRDIARTSGPEAVVFSASSPSTTAISDGIDWIQRLRRAFGSPNLVASMELCGWGRYFASAFTWGEAVPGVYLPDLDRAGCILFWGYNPPLARLTHATAASRALARGARLIAVDPRRVGLAHRADVWLRVRPGTDGALALAIAHVMIERGWFDRDFVRRWTNGPFLVRPDDGRLLRGSDLAPDGDPAAFVAWDEAAGRPVLCRPREIESRPLALGGAWTVTTRDGAALVCRPAFQLVAELCARHAPDASEDLTGIAAGDVERAARLLWESRPVAFYAWSGVEQHTNATQTARAIAQLYALTGSIDAPGGNVRFAAVPTNPVDGADLLPAEARARSLGLARRPLGAARFEFITSDDVYTAALEGRPYPVRGLVGFGANLLVAQPDGRRGREALAGLDFYLHADLFMNPTAEQADIVVPVASPFESEALAVGFEVSGEAQAFVQLRRPVVAPRGEARSDTEIAFALATRLGLGHHFWEGDIDAAVRHRLAPAPVDLETLRARPEGVAIPLETRHRKYAEPNGAGVRGFATRSGKVELYSESLLAHGHAPLPDFAEPGISPRTRPDLAAAYPLVLTSAKSTWFCESQHRGLPSLRRRAPDPTVEMHPDAAVARGIAEGDWVSIETPAARVRARAAFNRSLDPAVVCGQHGWWQGCEEIGAPSFDPFGPDSANFNLLIPHEPSDPIGGSVPLRSWLCQIARLG